MKPVYFLSSLPEMHEGCFFRIIQSTPIPWSRWSAHDAKTACKSSKLAKIKHIYSYCNHKKQWNANFQNWTLIWCHSHSQPMCVWTVFSAIKQEWRSFSYAVCMKPQTRWSTFSPVIQVTGLDAGFPPAEVFTREALIWARTPAACFRTQRIAHHVLFNCKTREQKENC